MKIQIFFQNSILKSLKHCTKELYFINIKNITKNEIYHTMYYFGNKFKFCLNKNQKDYNQIVYHPINAILPFILNINDDLKIIITMYEKNKTKYENRIKDFYNLNLKYKNIYITINDIKFTKYSIIFKGKNLY